MDELMWFVWRVVDGKKIYTSGVLACAPREAVLTAACNDNAMTEICWLEYRLMVCMVTVK